MFILAFVILQFVFLFILAISSDLFQHNVRNVCCLTFDEQDLNVVFDTNLKPTFCLTLCKVKYKTILSKYKDLRLKLSQN